MMNSEDFSHLVLSPQEVDIVIYHGNCTDGFASALAAWDYFKKNNGINVLSHKVEYHPAFFNQQPPDVNGKNVLICDFTYNYEQTMEMLKNANKLVILDHHESAVRKLENIPAENKVFRMDHSGAYLTWKYFYPDLDVPLLIKYVQDNDIWLKAMPNTREVTSYLFSLPFDFQEYGKLLDDNEITKIIPIAQGMQKQNQTYIDQSIKNCALKFQQIDGTYYFIAHINSTVLKSEIGNEVLKKYPNVDFSAVYSVNGDSVYYGLRSDENKQNVTRIAEKYGGGGHRNSSGMMFNYTTEFPGKLLDGSTLYYVLNNIYFNKDFVMLNCTHNKIHVAKYLLQNKYTEKLSDGTTRNVQQCNSIFRNLKLDSTFYEYRNFSLVWSLNGQETCDCVVSWVPDCPVSMFSIRYAFQLQENYNLNENDRICTFSCKYDTLNDFLVSFN